MDKIGVGQIQNQEVRDLHLHLDEVDERRIGVVKHPPIFLACRHLVLAAPVVNTAHDLLEGTMHQDQEARGLRVAQEGIVKGQIAAELAIPEIPLFVIQRRVDLIPEDTPVQDILVLLGGTEVLSEARDQKVELHGESPFAVVMKTAQQIVLIAKPLHYACLVWRVFCWKKSIQLLPRR